MEIKEKIIAIAVGSLVTVLTIEILAQLIKVILTPGENAADVNVVPVFGYAAIAAVLLFLLPGLISGALYEMRNPRQKYSEIYFVGVGASFVAVLLVVLLSYLSSDQSGFAGNRPGASLQWLCPFMLVGWALVSGCMSLLGAYVQREILKK